MNRESALLILLIATGLIACSDSSVSNKNTKPLMVAPALKRAATKPLDLSLAPPTEQQQQSADFSEHSKLPKLFSDNNKQNNVTVGAKVLNDANNPNYLDSLDGAEVSIDIKLH